MAHVRGAAACYPASMAARSKQTRRGKSPRNTSRSTRAKTRSRGKSSSRKTPWEKPAPAKAKHKRLSPKQKQSARQRAKRAGRPYPNLVDNMAARKEGQ